MLAASLHSTHERGERQFLFEHLDRLSAGDLLLLDRGYPCRWLVAVLNQRSINFCMRVDNSDTGFTCVRQFLRSGERERIVMRRAPHRQKARLLAAQPACPDRQTNLPPPGKPFKTSGSSAKTS